MRCCVVLSSSKVEGATVLFYHIWCICDDKMVISSAYVTIYTFGGGGGMSDV
jgi:hypothetical protein